MAFRHRIRWQVSATFFIAQLNFVNNFNGEINMAIGAREGHCHCPRGSKKAFLREFTEE